MLKNLISSQYLTKNENYFQDATSRNPGKHKSSQAQETNTAGEIMQEDEKNIFDLLQNM